jgi:4-amino-4-deoxy-L-arabinose transferase-like glycosyltransferase
VLHPGDYPHAYLEEIKARGFPPDMPVDPIRYEFHQPPLYYLLAAPVYALAGGALLPLRFVSVALGAGIVIAAYAVARRVSPAQPWIAAGAAAFVAFLPQHLATVSQVGNDVLAELLVALALLAALTWVQPGRVWSTWQRLGLGLLLGLILITKTTAYVVLPLVLAVMVWRWLAEKATGRRIAADLALVWGVALLMALPWYARNVAIYGWPDALGLIRHDDVVVGQLRTADYLAQNGPGSYVRRLGEFTFKSFWGVFGWLGVFMDSRAYLVLALITLTALGGLASRALLRWSGTSAKRAAPAMAAGANRAMWVLVLFTVLAYGWYNMQFVQHQGRYLFAALIPIAIGFAVGWDEAVQPRTARWLAAVSFDRGGGVGAGARCAPARSFPMAALCIAVCCAPVDLVICPGGTDHAMRG